MPEETTESLAVMLEGDTATVFGSGKTWGPLRRDVISRSTLLHHAMEYTANSLDENLEITVYLPRGVMSAWLEGLEALGLEWSAASTQTAAQGIKEAESHKDTINHLKAADFLDDQDAVSRLCSKAEQLLFAPFIQNQMQQVDDTLAKEISELPSNLQEAVLATSEIPPLLQIYILPGILKEVALHVAFPSIRTHSSITAYEHQTDNAYVASFWKVVGNVSTLKALHVPGNHISNIPHSMLQNVRKMTHLVSLKFDNFHSEPSKLSRDKAKSFADVLSCLTLLEALHLVNIGICGDTARLLAASIAKLRRLRFVDISDNFSMSTRGVRAMTSVFAQLPCLQSIKMDRCDRQGQGGADFWRSLPRCSSLTNLCLDGNANYLAGVRLGVFCSLSGYKALQHLQFSFQDWAEELSLRLQKLTALRTLKLEYMNRRWDHAGALHTLGPSLAHLTQLQHLSVAWGRLFCGCGIDKVLGLMVSSMTTLTRLQTLDICTVALEDETAEELGHFISSLPQLKSLAILHSLAPAFFNRSPLAAFLQAVKGTSALEHLEVAGTRLQEGDEQALTSCVASVTALRSLKFTGPGMRRDARDAQMVVSSITRLSLLQSLDLQCLTVASEALEEFAEAIGSLLSLKTLLFRHSHLQDAGMKALALQLPKLVLLQELGLHNTVFDVDGAIALSECLSALQSLRKLDLSYNYMQDYGLDALAPAIGELSALQALHLKGNSLNCSSMEILCTHIVNGVPLEELDVSENLIEKWGMECLARNVSKITTLKKLIVCKNDLNQEHGLQKFYEEYRGYLTLRIEDSSYSFIHEILSMETGEAFYR